MVAPQTLYSGITASGNAERKIQKQEQQQNNTKTHNTDKKGASLLTTPKKNEEKEASKISESPYFYFTIPSKMQGVATWCIISFDACLWILSVRCSVNSASISPVIDRLNT